MGEDLPERREPTLAQLHSGWLEGSAGRLSSGRAARGAAALAALVVGTVATAWLFLANPETPGELGSRLALGLSPDRHAAEIFAGSQRLERARAYFDLEEPTDEQAALAQREMLRARGHFARALERAGSEEEAIQARRAWGEADLVLARWALERGKGGLLSGDDEDLFRWGLAYAREGLALSDLEPGTRAELERTAAELERELSFWR